MHQQDVFIRRRLGLDEILGRRDFAFQQPLMDQPVFLRRKDVRSNGQVEFVAINELERQHECSVLGPSGL